MKVKRITSVLLTITVFSFLFISAAISEEGNIHPEKKIKAHKIIRLDKLGVIFPPVATVEPGTTVIWVNDARTAVEIKFEGKQVTLACKSPVHFIVDSDGSFVSDKIPHGAVASLCMVERGEFNYVARKVILWGIDNLNLYQRPVREFRGKIIVK